MRKVFTGLTALLMLAVVLQFFLAGSGAFDTAPNDESFGPHRALGYLILLLAVVAALVGALARIPGRLLGRTVLIVGLALLQPVIAGLASALNDSGGGATSAGKLVFGLHAVNGLIIAAVLATIVRRARELSNPTRAKTGAAVTSDAVAGIRPPKESASGTGEPAS
jgi:Kef-type K+ transport system membrane component KefB